MHQATTIIDLARLSLSHGEGPRLDLPLRLESLHLAGQDYAVSPDVVETRIDVSRPSGGYAFRLRFPLRIEGPCVRCLEGAAIDAECAAREAGEEEPGEEKLLRPGLGDGPGVRGRWAPAAAALAI